MSPYHPYLWPAVALVAGILILIQPGLLSVIVAVYLIVTGILGLLGASPTSRWWSREVGRDLVTIGPNQANVLDAGVVNRKAR